MIQQQVHQTQVQDVNDLRQGLIDVWAGVRWTLLTRSVTSRAGVAMSAFELQEGILNTVFTVTQISQNV